MSKEEEEEKQKEEQDLLKKLVNVSNVREVGEGDDTLGKDLQEISQS